MSHDNFYHNPPSVNEHFKQSEQNLLNSDFYTYIHYVYFSFHDRQNNHFHKNENYTYK